MSSRGTAPLRLAVALGAMAVGCGGATVRDSDEPWGAPSGSTVEIVFVERREPAEGRRGAAASGRVDAPAAVGRGAGEMRGAQGVAAAPAGRGTPEALRAPWRTEAAWGTARWRPIVGDGSHAGELVAAAQRVVGLRAHPERSFRAHVLLCAGLPGGAEASAEPSVEALLERFREAHVLVPVQAVGGLVQGDLLFYDEGDAALRLAVVEAVDREERVHLIALGGVGEVAARRVLEPRGGAGPLRVKAVARP